MSPVELFTEGGYTMLAILAASVAAITEVVYCAFALSRKRVLRPALINIALNANEASVEDNMRACRSEGGAFSAVLLSAMENRKLPREEVENMVEAAGRRAAHVLSRGVLVLEVVAAVAPLLGLLGTVIGMREAFAHIAEDGVKNIGSLPEGISKALITTITGLVVAIPAYVFHSYFQRRIDELMLEMEHYAIQLLGRLRG